MTCAQFDSQFDAYVAGTLGEADALALEMHASECARCEARMNDATPVAFAIRDFALPDELRAITLARVAARRNQRRTSYWAVGIAAMAAAVAAFVVISERAADAPVAPLPVAVQPPAVAVPLPQVATSNNAPKNSTPTVKPPSPKPTTAKPPSQVAIAPPKFTGTTPKDRLIYEHSSAEFVALDTAARELEQALAKSPNDPQLRAFLETVRTRRSELERRVRDASS